MPKTLEIISASPLSSDALHSAPHERITLKDGVEVVYVEGEHVAVGLRTNACYPPDRDGGDGG